MEFSGSSLSHDRAVFLRITGRYRTTTRLFPPLAMQQAWKNPGAKYMDELHRHRVQYVWQCQSQPKIWSDVYVDRSTWVPRTHLLPHTSTLLCLIRCDDERHLVREIYALEAR